MAIDRVTVTGSFVKFGELVKQWAKEPGTRPTSLAAFRDQCAARQVTVQIPSYVEGVVFVQHQKEVLTIHLPPADMLKDAEQQLENGGAYPLPPFYPERFGAPQLQFPDTPAGKKARKDFHSERIGDYCISLCV